jgi:hypothetical protein
MRFPVIVKREDTVTLMVEAESPAHAEETILAYIAEKTSDVGGTLAFGYLICEDWSEKEYGATATPSILTIQNAGA